MEQKRHTFDHVSNLFGNEILEQKNLRVSPLGERVLSRVYPDGTKLSFYERGLYPVIQTKLEGQARKIYDRWTGTHKGKIASIASSGNMPDWWVTKIPQEILDKGIDVVQGYIQTSDTLKGNNPRFLDTKDQFLKAQKAIDSNIDFILSNLKEQGATKTLFSVCSAAAGFDMMLVQSLRRRIEQGDKDISIVVTIPFDIPSVRNYSVSVGLQKQVYLDTFQWLVDNDATKQHGNVFFTTF